MTAGNQRIAPTAHFTAQMWLRAGFPNAGAFDTLTGRAIWGAVTAYVKTVGRLSPPPVRYHNDYLVIRHTVYEERLRELDPTYVLEVGAGLSPRGLTFAEARPDLRYVEVDLPNMAAAKRAALGARALPANYHLGPADLLGTDFAASLPAAPRAGDRIVIITEGVCDYLDMAEKETAWRNLAGFLRDAGGGVYLSEVHARDRFDRYPRGARLYTTLLGALVGASFRDRLFPTLADAEAMLRTCGFDHAGALDIERLNSTSLRPPLGACPWRLVEARVGD